jgi:excisionase family DNA binding protein
VAAPIPITRHQPQIQSAQPPTDQRGMNVKAAAKYLGVSIWQIRKFIREDAVPSFQIGNRDMVDRADLDALIERLKNVA